MKVTGNASTGEGRRGAVTQSSESPEFISFGPRGSTSDSAAGRLFDERVDATVAAPARSARSGGFLNIAGTIAKKIVETAVSTATRYKRPSFARARTDEVAAEYGRRGGYLNLPWPGAYVWDGDIDNGLKRYFPNIRTADQEWLRDVTRKDEYVHGATVTDGPDSGTYIDRGLFKRAGRYIRQVARGVRDTAENAAVFIDGLVTGYHEQGHYRGISGEPEAEQYGWNRVRDLASRGDRLVRYALSQVLGTGYYRPELVPVKAVGAAHRTR
jgi:hypothetical protein